MAIDGLSTLFASSHGDGEVATEAVQLIADLLRRLKCIVPPSTLDCLLDLRFPDMLASALSAAETGPKKKKQKKAKDDVDRSFLEGQAAAGLAARCNDQTATLEALFEMLFRVLKTCAASGMIQQTEATPLSRAQFLKKFPLLFPALRLLSKYAHLISVEYIQDIAAELRVLLRSSTLPHQERLRVLLTAAEMVHRQGDAISTDYTGYFTELYAALQHTMLEPLLEGAATAVAGRVAAIGADREEDYLFASMATAAEEGAKAGEQICFLLPSILEALILGSRTLDAPRQAAFAKRMLAGVTAAGDSGLAMGLLCLVHRMLRRSRRLQGMLLHEPGGAATQGYQPEGADPTEAGALATPLWELSLLSQHYHPHVAAASTQLTAGNPAGLLPLLEAIPAFAAAYSTVKGGFNPAP